LHNQVQFHYHVHIGLRTGNSRPRGPAHERNFSKISRRHGLSQRELAKCLNVTRGMIDYYERRASNAELDFIERAAAALEVSVTELRQSTNRHHFAPNPVPFLSWSVAWSK
jgi:transcriptional regulator with XRE-family HTH domain